MAYQFFKIDFFFWGGGVLGKSLHKKALKLQTSKMKNPYNYANLKYIEPRNKKK